MNSSGNNPALATRRIFVLRPFKKTSLFQFSVNYELHLIHSKDIAQELVMSSKSAYPGHTTHAGSHAACRAGRPPGIISIAAKMPVLAAGSPRPIVSLLDWLNRTSCGLVAPKTAMPQFPHMTSRFRQRS